MFAPTARIVWGSPTLITIDLASCSSCRRRCGSSRSAGCARVLPDEREAIVRLQVDVLGVIDFDRAEAAVDATLVDSRLAQFALTGDMALRMSWGAQPSFLLAVGGFHPRFAAPPGFPALERVAVALAERRQPEAAPRGLPRADVEHGAVRRARRPGRAGRAASASPASCPSTRW